MRRLLAPFLILAAMLASGCTSLPYMPLTEDGAKVDPAKPIYLMSVVLRNDYKLRWQPKVLNIQFSRQNGTAPLEYMAFRMDDKGTIAGPSESDSKTYLIRFIADGPNHTILGINAMASAFPSHGFYFVPLHAQIAAGPAGVYYLGSVKASVRERQGNEFRAGPAIPLLDQAITGASTGTFDIQISDDYATDVALFRKTFDSLQDVDIAKAVLPPWDRAKAQLYWEQN
jgi:hypothetical protein